MEKSNSEKREKQHWLLMQTTHVGYAHSHSLWRPDGCRVEAAHKAHNNKQKLSPKAPQKATQKAPRPLFGNIKSIICKTHFRNNSIHLREY